MNKRFFVFCAWLFGILALPVAAQEANRSLSYGETASAYFEGESSHTWTFTGNVGDIIEIEGRRIAGRFEPKISLRVPSGTEIRNLDYVSLSESGEYQIEVRAENNQNNGLLILNEYSLSLNLLARHRTSIEAGLNPLPILEPPSNFFTGTSRVDETLGIAIYGNASLSQPDPINARNRYVLLNMRSLNINNANPLSRAVSAIAFIQNGVALQSVTGAVFFSDTNLSIESNNSITTITLENGTSIITDFYRINSIQAQNGFIQVIFADSQVLIAQGQRFEFLRRGGINGEGPNAEPVNLVRVDGQELQTDLQAWETLALLGEDVRVYYDELRFLGDSAQLELFFDESIDIRSDEWSINSDSRGMGDIVLRGDLLRVLPLDGREISQARSNFDKLFIQEGRIRINGRDGSSSYSLPDGSLFESPSTIAADNAALPNQANFRPRNFNNLGAHPFDYHPNPDFDFALFPVNRVNGNFFYQNTDFTLENTSLPLEWTRSYNSMIANQASPMGNGWRHSYQYELDIRTAPLGEVQLALADGSRHIFTASNGLYRSSSLLSWTIIQHEDATWEAFTSEGRSYDFGYAGRLEAIHEGMLSLLFSPVPREYLGNYQGGFFVTDSYGRRLEVYSDANGLIREVRDVLGRSIRYDYEGQELRAVAYSHNNETARYNYQNGRLIFLSERQNIALQYDAQGRVSRHAINPEGDLQAVRSYAYAQGSTTESEFVNDSERQHVFSYDDAFRPIRYDTPRQNWTYRWTYNNQTGRLAEVILPDRAVLRYQYDEFGYLISFTDPIFGAGSGSYAFRYASPDNRLRLLTGIDIPSASNYMTLEYDTDNQLAAVNLAISVSPRQNIRIGYSYDALGRISSISYPDRSIVFNYDEFGYLSSRNEGNGARVINLEHDILGRLVSESDGRGTLTTYLWSNSHNHLDSKIVGDWRYDYAYDAAGNLTEYRLNERSQFFSYDALNHLSSAVDSLGRQTLYTVDEVGNVLTIISPDGTEQFTYDSMNMLVSYRDKNGFESRYSVTLNIEGNRTIYRTDYANGEARSYTYDPLGRIRQVISYDRLGLESFSYNLNYNALGFLTGIEERHVPAGRSLAISYDLQGNPLTATLNNTATTSYSYNEARLLSSVTDPEGRVNRYDYNVLGYPIRHTLPDGTILNYSYDENGNRTSYTEAGREEWFYTYDSHNRLTTVIDPADGMTSYEYDKFGNLSAIVNPQGTRIELAYDDASRLLEFSDLAGNVTSYRYNNETDLITRIVQTGGLSSDFFYDSANNLTAITQAGGREVLFGRDNEGRVVSLTDSLGFSSFYAYNTIGTVGRITNSLGNQSLYRWSASGRIVGYSGTIGATYSYAGDSIGRLSSINDTATEQNSAVNTLIAYDDSGFIESIRFGTTGTIGGERATIHRYSYTANGQIASYLPPEASSPYSFEYDSNGRMISSVNPNGSRTNYRYDAMGNMIELRRAVGTEWESLESYTYDILGNISSYTSPEGAVSEYRYDSANHLIERLDNGERLYRYEYDAYGRLTRSIDPNEHEILYRYDLYGNLIVEESAGLSSRYEYDEVNNLRRVQYPAGQSILMTYNALGKMVRYTDAENNAWSYSYDDAGNLSQITDPLGNTSSYIYDTNNRLSSLSYPNDSSVTLLYDATGQLSELRLPNNQRIRSVFDRAGRLTTLEYDTDEIIRYQYDNMGNLTLQTNADGRTIRYEYDAHNRMVSRATDEASQNRSYDNSGRLRELSQGTSLYRFVYEPFGKLSTYQSLETTVNYSYDPAGNLLVRDAGAFGRIEYEYDEHYRPSKIIMGDEWVELEYNENGWRTRLLRSNGVETRYVYNGNGRVRNILHLNAAGERLDGFAYEYDAIGNILRVTRIDNFAVLYSYNDMQQLISERWLSADNQLRYSVGYAYDAAGNRAEQITRIGQNNPERTIFIYNNQNQLIEEIRNAEFTIEDRLAIPTLIVLVLLPSAWYLRRRPRFLPLALAIVPLSIPFFQGLETPPTRYSYDVNGNLSTIEFATGNRLDYAYDSFQRLIAINGTNDSGIGLETSIRYDALGRITEVIEGETARRFVYDNYGLIAIETDGVSSLVFAPMGETLLQVSEDEALWPLQDAIGIRRNDATSEGVLVAQIGFNSNSFGEAINPYETETSFSPLLINGAYYLPQSQVYLRGEMAYEPRIAIGLQRPALPDYTKMSFNPLEGGLMGLNPIVPDVDPSRFVENPILEPMVDMNSVHRAQAAETERLLAVAQMAYSRMNQPNILAEFALPDVPFGVDELTAPQVTIPSVVSAWEDFAAELREVPLYEPLVEELPYLLNFVDSLP